MRNQQIEENLLIGELKKIGVYILDYRAIKLTEQITLFANADSIISFTGSGLANMIWMPKNSNIYEIGNYRELVTVEIPILAKMLGHNYNYIKVDETTSFESNLVTIINYLGQLKEK